VTDWLIDKSALVRLGKSPDAEEWASRIERGLVRITTMTRLEIGYSARTAAQARSVFGTPPISMMPVEYLTPAIEDRAHRARVNTPVPGPSSIIGLEAAVISLAISPARALLDGAIAETPLGSDAKVLKKQNASHNLMSALRKQTQRASVHR
jgi:hypothetical protein